MAIIHRWSTATGKLVKGPAENLPLVPLNPKPEPPKPEPPKPMPEVPNHLDVVTRMRAKYAHLSGNHRAYTVTNASAWELRNEGAGLFYKPSGNNYNSRNVNVLVFKGNYSAPAGKYQSFDVLRDAENKAVPVWQRTEPSGFSDVSKWRAPVPPEAGPEPPEPPEPTPPNCKVTLLDIRGDLVDLQDDLTDVIEKIDKAIADQ